MDLGARPHENFFKICILLWLRMPFPAEFEHFYETKILLPTLEKQFFACFQESQRPLLDRSARPPPPPHQFYHIFVGISMTNFLKSGGVRTPPIPPLGYATAALQKLQKLQNRAARIVTNSPYDASALPLIKQLGWLNIQQMIEFETTRIVHKSLHNEVPEYLQGLFTRVSDKCVRE